jgi:hypothetical protein
MRKQNMYYDDLIIGNILQKQWSVKWLKTAFKSIYEVDELGGQIKFPTLRQQVYCWSIRHKKKSIIVG